MVFLLNRHQLEIVHFRKGNINKLRDCCHFQTIEKPAPGNATGQFFYFKNMEEKEQWLEAFREAMRL